MQEKGVTEIYKSTYMVLDSYVSFPIYEKLHSLPYSQDKNTHVYGNNRRHIANRDLPVPNGSVVASP